MPLGGDVFGGLVAQDAGCHGGDADGARTHLSRERAGHGDHRALARDIGEQPRRTPQRGVGGQVHHAAAAGGAQHRAAGAGDEPGAADIHIHHTVPGADLDGVVVRAADSGGDGGVVDQPVQSAFVAGDVLGHGGDAAGIDEVNPHEARAQPGRGGAALLLQHIGQHQARAGLGAGFRDGAADAAGGAGDEYDAAFQRAHHCTARGM